MENDARRKQGEVANDAKVCLYRGVNVTHLLVIIDEWIPLNVGRSWRRLGIVIGETSVGASGTGAGC